MNVSLTPELEKLVHLKVEAGLYSSASEVIREALRLMDLRDHERDLRNNVLRQKIAAGMDSLRAGKGSDGEAIFDRIEAELSAGERHGTV